MPSRRTVTTLLRAQRGEVLGHDRLLERERRLELLDGALALHQALEEADARRVRERAEEVALEDLQRALAYI